MSPVVGLVGVLACLYTAPWQLALTTGISVAFEVSPCASVEEFKAALFGIGQYFGAPPTEEMTARFLKLLSMERMHAAREGGEVVGGAGAFSYTLSVPGGKVPCAGVTVVGVYPTHRRRGVLTAMMRAQLDDVRARGEPLAALWASNEQIYGRFGYGMASLQGPITLPRAHAAFARPLPRPDALRFLEPEEALSVLPPLWERFSAERAGVFSRSRAWWELRVLADPPERRGGGGPKRFIALSNKDQVEAYAIYRHHPRIEAGFSTSRLEVIEALGLTPRAMAQIWRYLLDIDWIETITADIVPVDHPLLWLLAEPRHMKLRLLDGLWVRLVDVEAALSARAYTSGDPLTFAVEDSFCPWNTGCFTLEGGKARRTERAPALRCGVAALGSVYLGGFSFRALADAGLVEELSPGAVARADALFRTERHPWCPEIF